MATTLPVQQDTYVPSQAYTPSWALVVSIPNAEQSLRDEIKDIIAQMLDATGTPVGQADVIPDYEDVAPDSFEPLTTRVPSDPGIFWDTEAEDALATVAKIRQLLVNITSDPTVSKPLLENGKDHLARRLAEIFETANDLTVSVRRYYDGEPEDDE